MQAIVIPGSPESGATDQTELTGVARTESKEADSVPSALQVIHPSDEGRSGKSKFIRSGMPSVASPTLHGAHPGLSLPDATNP